MPPRTPSHTLISSFIAASLMLVLINSSLNWLPIAKVAASSPSPNNSITVTSAYLGNGTELPGFSVDLRISGDHIKSGFTPVTFGNLQTGIQYQVVVYWFGNYYFRHFSSGNLNRYALVTLNATVGQNSLSLTGLYQYVPPSQAASLNIFAEFPNGTRIGTTFNNSDYIQHTPGMWLTVTPPGSTTPFTGSYTGGSILPFILVDKQTYTVDMSAGYKNVHFSRWKDNNSTDRNRQIKLNGNATYTAIYNDTSAVPEFPVGLPLVFVVILIAVVFSFGPLKRTSDSRLMGRSVLLMSKKVCRSRSSEVDPSQTLQLRPI